MARVSDIAHGGTASCDAAADEAPKGRKHGGRPVYSVSIGPVYVNSVIRYAIFCGQEDDSGVSLFLHVCQGFFRLFLPPIVFAIVDMLGLWCEVFLKLLITMYNYIIICLFKKYPNYVETNVFMVSFRILERLGGRALYEKQHESKHSHFQRGTQYGCNYNLRRRHVCSAFAMSAHCQLCSARSWRESRRGLLKTR